MTQLISAKKSKSKSKTQPVAQSSRPLFTYKILAQEILHSSGEQARLLLDLGFLCSIELSVAQSKKLKPGDIVQSRSKLASRPRILKVKEADPSWLYHYKAYIERVVDGDTLWTRIDLGFRFWIRQKLRLRGLDAPELNTRKGQRAKRFVEEQIKGVPWVTITTTKPDKYDRYLSDIFMERNGRSVHLNQLLLNQGLARPEGTAPASGSKRGINFVNVHSV